MNEAQFRRYQAHLVHKRRGGWYSPITIGPQITIGANVVECRRYNTIHTIEWNGRELVYYETTPGGIYLQKERDLQALLVWDITTEVHAFDDVALEILSLSEPEAPHASDAEAPDRSR